MKMIRYFIRYKVEYEQQSEDSACCLDDGTMHKVCECNEPIAWCKQECTKDAYCKGYVKSSVITDADTGESKGYIYDNWDTINLAMCWLVEGACVDYAVSVAVQTTVVALYMRVTTATIFWGSSPPADHTYTSYFSNFFSRPGPTALRLNNPCVCAF